MIDLGTGALTFAGICAALYARQTGAVAGQHVEASLLQTGMSQLGYHLTAYTMAGAIPERAGSAVWHIVPYQAFRTADGFVLVGATNDAVWRRMAGVLGQPDLADHPDYATALARSRNRAVLIANIEPIFLQRSNAEWIAALDAVNVPCSPVQDLAQAIEHPQVAAMGIVEQVQDGRGGTLRLCAPPVSLSATPAMRTGRPPDLGEHTAEILSELGFAGSEIEALRKEGII